MRPGPLGPVAAGDLGGERDWLAGGGHSIGNKTQPAEIAPIIRNRCSVPSYPPLQFLNFDIDTLGDYLIILLVSKDPS